MKKSAITINLFTNELCKKSFYFSFLFQSFLMFFFYFFSVFVLSAPGEGDDPNPDYEPTPAQTPAQTTPPATWVRDEEVTYVTVYLPEDATSQGLFIAMIVLLVIVFLGIIATVIYFCVVSKKQSQIGAADFELEDQKEPPAATKTNRPQTTTTGTRGTIRGTTTHGTRTMRTTTGRPQTATTTHTKSIYAVNTVIL